MDHQAKTILWQQFGAAIDALENAIVACPENLWFDRTRQPEFWYVAYHTIFWLDFYMDESGEHFTPPSPYGLEELDPAGVLPDRPYTKEELLTYLAHGREKSRRVIRDLTDDQANRPYRFGNANLTVAEKFLYVMRHNQHHAAQLNLILRQTIDSAPRWAFKSKVGLD